jgi:hypothetical protein
MMTVSYTSLMVPILAKYVFKPGRFKLQGYAGLYGVVPLGEMEVAIPGGGYSAQYAVPFGFIVGGGAGIKLGPGVLFGDLRFAGDFGNTVANHNGNRDIARRSKLSYSLGYEIGLVGKK